MAIEGRALLDILFRGDPAGDYAGKLRGQILTDRSFAEGTTTNKADKWWFDDATVTGSGTNSVDLQTQVGAGGSAMGLVDVRVFALKAPTTNGADLRITPNATNGWTALFSSSGATDDPQIDVAPGTTLILLAPVDNAYPVSATDKVFDITNLDGSAATYTILIAGAGS